MKRKRTKLRKEINYGLITRIFSWSVVVAFSIFFVFIVFLFKHGVMIRYVSFNASAFVINMSQTNITKLGVSVDPDELAFGIVPLGGNVTREIELKAPSNLMKTKIQIVVEGNVSEKVEIERNNIVLSPGEAMNVKIKFVGNEVGNYTGMAHVLICIPRYSVSEKFLNELCEYKFEAWRKDI